MSQSIKYAARPVTLESTLSAPALDGVLVKRADGKYTIRDDAHGGYLEVHGDGSYGYAPDGADHFQAGATYVGWNLLEFPGESDRQDGLLHATFLVPITTPV